MPREKLASAKCIKEEKEGAVTELLSTVLDKRCFLPKLPKGQLARKAPHPVGLRRGRGWRGDLDQEPRADLALRPSVSWLRGRWGAERFCHRPRDKRQHSLAMSPFALCSVFLGLHYGFIHEWMASGSRNLYAFFT